MKTETTEGGTMTHIYWSDWFSENASKLAVRRAFRKQGFGLAARING